MILSVVQQPNTYSPVSADIWFGTYTADYSLNNFKYIFDILSYNTIFTVPSTLGSYRVPPRPANGYGLISPSKLLRTVMSWSFAPNISLPTAYTSGVGRFGFRYGASYNPSWIFSDLTSFSPSTNAWLVNSTGYTWDVAIGDVLTILMTNPGVNTQFNGEATVVDIGYAPGFQYVKINKTYASSLLGPQTGLVTEWKRMFGTQSGYYSYLGTRQYTEIATNFGNTNVILNDTNQQNYLTSYKNCSYLIPYNILAITGKSVDNPSDFIYGNTKTIYPGQYETTSFLIDPSATSSYWRINTYNKNYQITGTYDSTLSGVLSTGGLATRYDLPTGYQNIVNGGYIASATMSAAKYYSVCIYKLTQVAVPGVPGNPPTYITVKVAKALRFYEIVENCSPYPQNFRLVFLNRQGGTDYWNFNWKSTNTLTNQQNIYRKQLPYNYSVGDRQDTVLSNKAQETFVISTDWISEYDAEYLKELITSTDVYVYNETTQQKLPIIVLDTSYVKKTAIDNKLFCITLNFRYSYDINLQNN